MGQLAKVFRLRPAEHAALHAPQAPNEKRGQCKRNASPPHVPSLSERGGAGSDRNHTRDGVRPNSPTIGPQRDPRRARAARPEAASPRRPPATTPSSSACAARAWCPMSLFLPSPIQASKARLKIVMPASAARLAGEAAASSGSQAGVLFSGHGARALRVGQLDARTDRSRSALGGDLEGRRAGARADPTRRAAPDRSVQDDRAFVRTGRLSRSTAGIPADVRARRAAAPLREAAPAVNEVFRAAADLQAFCDAQGWRHALIGGSRCSGGASRVRRWTSTSRW
jgi:hypothetical protein